jgi:hypothetical protein
VIVDTEAIVAGLVMAVLVSIVTGAIAGNVASQRTIAALIVHIDYLRSHIDRHEETISRAHRRIDDLEKR